MDPVRELEEIGDAVGAAVGITDVLHIIYADRHCRDIRTWLDRYGPLIAAAVECEELWSRDYRNARDPGDIQRRLNEARAKVAAAYRTALEKGEPK